MERIIATTDFSANSKAGIRFAILLAEARNAEIIFLHVHQMLRASMWSDKEYAYYIKRNEENVKKELTSFTRQVYRSMNVLPKNHQIAVYHDLSPTDGIIEYAKKVNASYICISTRGAGILKKLYGTNTSRLITKSDVPVLCIPSSYHKKPIKHILYASDMMDYKNELKKVVAFAKPMQATVEMLHLSYAYELAIDEQLMEDAMMKDLDYKVDLHYKTRDIEKSMIEDISMAVKKSKPSVLVMFTNRERSFFERLFISSNAQEYSFTGKVPMLIFNKKNKR